MNTKTRKSRKSSKGFTLIEILIVVAVLGVLALFTVPKFSGIFSNTTAKELVHNLSVLNGQLETFEGLEGTFGTAAVGSATADGVLPNTTVTDVVAALQAGVWIRGQMIQMPSGTIDTTGMTYNTSSHRFEAGSS